MKGKDMDKAIDLHDMGRVALMSPATLLWLRDLGEVADYDTINGFPVVIDEGMPDGVVKLSGAEG